METHVLIVNLRGSSWDFIPHDLWSHILLRFIAKVCDGVSFDSITTAEEVNRLDVFADYAPMYLRQASFRPYDAPTSGDRPEPYLHSVALFRLDEWTASLLEKQLFNSWGAGNAGADADELVFWSGDRMKVHAIPYEGQVYFDHLTRDERDVLVRADKRIERNLHPV